MSQQNKSQIEKHNAKRFYLLMHLNFFENFKHKVNKTYASFKNKKHLNYNYEKKQEERNDDLNTTYQEILNQSNNINYRKIISNIFYSKNIEDAFIELEKANYTDEMFVITVIDKSKEQIRDLNKLKDKLFENHLKFNFLSSIQKEQLSLLIDSYVNTLDDFIDSQELLHADFFTDIEDIEIDTTFENDDTPLIIDNNESVNINTKEINNSNLHEIMSNKIDIGKYENYTDFTEIEVDYDKLLENLLNGSDKENG